MLWCCTDYWRRNVCNTHIFQLFPKNLVQSVCREFFTISVVLLPNPSMPVLVISFLSCNAIQRKMGISIKGGTKMVRVTQQQWPCIVVWRKSLSSLYRQGGAGVNLTWDWSPYIGSKKYEGSHMIWISKYATLVIILANKMQLYCLASVAMPLSALNIPTDLPMKLCMYNW